MSISEKPDPARGWLFVEKARAAASRDIANVLTLGITLPTALSKWADAHRQRSDVLAL